MKKFVYIIVATSIVSVTGLVLYCSNCQEEHRSRSAWKPEKEVEVITWDKLDTMVFQNPRYKVECPDCFVRDSSLLKPDEAEFWYADDDDFVNLRCYVLSNTGHQSTETVADSIVEYRSESAMDKIKTQDMHPD